MNVLQNVVPFSSTHPSKVKKKIEKLEWIRGTQWICSSEYLFLRQIFTGLNTFILKETKLVAGQQELIWINE